MLTIREGDKYVEIEPLEYEYPPGWGAGMPYKTDYLITRIVTCDGEETVELEDTFFRYSELEAIYDASLAILDGESYGFEADIEDPHIGFYVEIEEDLLAVNFQLAGETLFSVCDRKNPVEFRAFTDKLDEMLQRVSRF